MYRLFVLVFLLFFFTACKKEEGCTNPLANNYNPDAEQDDGSCFFTNNPGNISNITGFTTEDGLISNYLRCVSVDNLNNLWIGTPSGVQVFNGSSIAVYDQDNYPEMLSNNINCIKVASNENVWFGSDYGLNKLIYENNESTIEQYTNADGLISNQVRSIDEDPDGGIWIGTTQGVSYYDGINWVSFSSPDLPFGGVSATSFDLNGDKWFASPLGGVTHFDGDNFTTYNETNGLISKYVRDILIDLDGNKWIGTDKGMTMLDNSNSLFTHFTRMYIMPPPDTLNPVVDISMDSWGRIWNSIYVGYLGVGGVTYWDGNSWFDLDVSDGIIGSNIKGLVIDSEDNVWVATSIGLSKIKLD